MIEIGAILEKANKNWDSLTVEGYIREVLAVGYHHEVLLKLLSLAEVPKGKKIVDLGCGPGLSTKIIHTFISPNTLIAVDPSEHALEVARFQRLSGVVYARAAAENLDDVVSNADVVVAATVVPYFEDESQAFDGIRRSLTRDGILLANLYLHVGGWTLERTSKFMGIPVINSGREYDQIGAEELFKKQCFRIKKSNFEPIRLGTEVIAKKALYVLAPR